MEIDSVIAAAIPVTTRTWVDPPAATTPSAIPNMLTSPSCPPRITSLRELFVLCFSFPINGLCVLGSTARTARPRRVEIGAFISKDFVSAKRSSYLSVSKAIDCSSRCLVHARSPKPTLHKRCPCTDIKKHRCQIVKVADTQFANLRKVAAQRFNLAYALWLSVGAILPSLRHFASCLPKTSADPKRYIKSFVTASCADHLRQHERVTAENREIEQRAQAFHLGPEPPKIIHLISEEMPK